MDQQLIVGVDIGKSTHYASVIDSTGKQLGGAIKFGNSQKGAALLLERIASVNKANVPVVFGLEATGHYWLALYSFLKEKGYALYVINPYQSDAWRKMVLSSTKTDKEDAYIIADIIRFGHVTETKLADETLVALRNITRFKVALNQQMTDTKRRIITVMDQIFPEFESLFSDMFGKTARTLLSALSTPEALDAISIEQVTKLVIKTSRGRFRKEKAEEIKQKASSSFGITFALDSFTLEVELLLKQLSFVEDQIETVEKKIEELMKSQSSILTTLPGVGVQLAAAIIAEIGDIKRFRTSAQLVSYAGIDPTVRQSGNFVGTQNRMSKKGSPYLRLALWQAATTSIRFNPVLKTYYETKITQGKSKMTALGAVTRKLTGIIFSMLKHNKPFISSV